MPTQPVSESRIKSLGLIHGGDSEAWLLYRRQIDEQLFDRFGRKFRPRLLANDMHATAFEAALLQNDWNEVQRLAVFAAQQCIAGGAEGLMLCNSTLHVAADAIRSTVGVPLFHVIDAAVNNLVFGGVRRVGLLGTRFSIEQREWQERCLAKGIVAVVPTPGAMERVTHIIQEELGRGVVSDKSRSEIFRIAADFHRHEVRMIVNAAPALQLALNQDNAPFPLINSMALQVANAITWATGMTLPDLPARPCEFAA